MTPDANSALDYPTLKARFMAAESDIASLRIRIAQLEGMVYGKQDARRFEAVPLDDDKPSED